MEKKCFKCGQTKNFDEFYKHSRMADGHLGKCKECTKKDVHEHRKKNIERIRAYDRQRGKLPRRIKKCVEYNRKYNKDYPERYAAKILLNNAIRSGRIKRPERCSVCNKKTRICGHHEDYYKPLDVVWVCQVCHKRIHNGNFRNKE